MSKPLPDWFERHITLVDDRRFVRVFSGKYKNDPCGTGFADSRYALAKGPWRTLYAAENLKTAFAEVIIGDAFAKHGNHFHVLFDDLEEKVVSNQRCRGLLRSSSATTVPSQQQTLSTLLSD